MRSSDQHFALAIGPHRRLNGRGTSAVIGESYKIGMEACDFDAVGTPATGAEGVGEVEVVEAVDHGVTIEIGGGRLWAECGERNQIVFNLKKDFLRVATATTGS